MARWLEEVIWLLPVAQRPEGYNPLGIKNLDPEWIRRLGDTGQECYDAILARDTVRLGASMNACMECWEAILPHTVRHPSVTVDLKGILAYYQAGTAARCIPAAGADTCTSCPTVRCRARSKSRYGRQNHERAQACCRFRRL